MVSQAKTVGAPHLRQRQAKMPAGFYPRCKPWLDKLVVLLSLPVLAPLFCLVWLLIRIVDGGPALLAQTRIGKDGLPFTLYKFRTMRTGCNVPQSRLQAAFTQRRDRRITRLGRFLRRHRLDEMPQFLNVLRGEMSLIGPRPDLPALARFYADQLPDYDQRQRICPGITGWAQIHLGHVTDVHDVQRRLRHDIDYLTRQSAWLDLVIAIRTVRVILSGFGAR